MVAITRASSVTLPLYAAVQAAVTEGFARPEVLAIEGISEGAWAAAELGYRRRLSADESARAEYREALAGAEDRLSRRVSPLAEDIAAWVAFLDAYSAHPAPFELLQKSRLGLNDVSRLGRIWARRIEEDPELPRAIAEIRKRPAAPLPAISVEPAVLRRSSEPLPVVEVVMAPPPKEVRTFDLGLEIYAAICAEVAKGPVDLDERLRRLGVADAAARAELDARWKRQFERDPTLERDLRRLVAHLRNKPSLSGSAAPLPTAPPIPKAPPALQGTSLSVDIPRGPSLPFTPGPALLSLAPEPSVERPAGASLTGTALSVDVPRQALPFGGTSLSVDVPRGPSLPFTPVAEPASAEEPPFPRPEVKRSKLANLSRFELSSALTGVPRAPKAAETPVVSDECMPWLSLADHAALTLEIALAPQETAAVEARFGITAAGRAALDAHYRARVTAIPEVREAWHRAYAGAFAFLGARRQVGR